MLFEKIVRLVTSFQMVKDIFRISKHNTVFIVSRVTGLDMLYTINTVSGSVLHIFCLIIDC